MKYLTVERNGALYQVSFVEERFCDSFIIYSYNPNALIFKRRKLDDVSLLVASEIATKRGFDPKADDFFVNIANCLVDQTIKEIEKANEEENILYKQKNFFKNAS